MDDYIKEMKAQELRQGDHECEDWRCKECNPPPPTHPVNGPPVYDPYFKVWTYPYALNVPKKVLVKPDIPEKEVVEMEAMEIQCDISEEEKPERVCIGTETNEPPTFTDTAMQYEPPRIPTPRRSRFNVIDAELIIRRALMRAYKMKQLAKFRNPEGVRLCQDYSLNFETGDIEILTVSMLYNHQNMRCTYLRFSIFNYTLGMFTAFSTYSHLKKAEDFNVYAL